MKKSLVNKIIYLVVFFPYQLIGQTNIMATDWKKLPPLESQLQVRFELAAIGVHLSLKDASVPNGSNYVNACNKDNKFHLLEQAIVGVKLSNNQIYTFYFALIYDKKGIVTDSAYIGYIKTEFGEQSDKYLVKVKKTRLLLENNIFTEFISCRNDIHVIIEDQKYISKIEFPNQVVLNIKKYYHQVCDN